MGETSSGYELVRRVASGGMGEVFVAKKTGTGDFEKHVALKLLLPHLTASADAVRRFYDEARLAARMRHPNIVEIFDVGEAEGRPFLAMQLVEGVSLSQHLRHLAEQKLTVPLPIVRAIALSVCEALGYAHTLTDAKGLPLRLVHRDVTPSNILLSFTGAVQLTDFGIARIGDDGTRSGALQGKAAYIAPEQLTHEAELDARADLYSAAVTLYELLTGVSPFRRGTQDETFKAVLAGKAPPIRAARPDITPGLEAALARAMSRRPAERFPDAVSFRKALLDGPVASAPELAEHVRLVAAPFAQRPHEEEASQQAGTRSQVLRVTHSVSADPPPRPDITERTPRARGPLIAAVVLSAVIAVSLGIGLTRRELVVEPGTGPAGTRDGGGATVVAIAAPGASPVERPVGREVDTGLEVAPPPGRTNLGASGVADPTDRPSGPAPAVEDGPRRADRSVGSSLDVRPGPPGTDRRPARPPRPVKATAPPGPATAQPVRIGYLAADAVPWADVMVDGEPVDRTPFSKYPLPVGRHAITFRAPDGRTEVRTVAISEGATSSVRVEFAARR
ncbi:MAG: protein kinase [Myxococcaceae bacterium]|nr:protein kinase [Myxococcaceae bacterium]